MHCHIMEGQEYQVGVVVRPGCVRSGMLGKEVR